MTSSGSEGLSICETTKEVLFILRSPRHENQIRNPAFFEVLVEFGGIYIEREHGSGLSRCYGFSERRGRQAWHENGEGGWSYARRSGLPTQLRADKVF